MGNTVWVTCEQPGLDYSPAEKFGNIEFLTAKDFSNVRGSLRNEELVQELDQKLNHIGSDDYIVIAGSPYVSAVVFMLLGRRGVKRVNVLRWNNREYHYAPLQIDLTRV